MFAALTALLIAPPAAHADDTFDTVRRYWSVEIGAGFHFSGDATGNVRDISRPYADNEAGGKLPLGGGAFVRSVLRYPVGKVAPALLTRFDGWAGSSAVNVPGYDTTTRTMQRLEVQVGGGLCVEDGACVFGTYAFRNLNTTDTNYPITNLSSVLGDGDYQVDPFAAPVLSALVGDALVNLVLGTLDFESSKTEVDLTDHHAAQGIGIAGFAGLGERVTVDGGAAYYWSEQVHTTQVRVTKDITAPEDVQLVDYDWAKSVPMFGVDFGVSVGVLPSRYPAQLAIGVRASSLILIDSSAERSVGAYVAGMGFVSTKW